MQTASTPPKQKPTHKARPLPSTHRPAKRPLLRSPQAPPRTIYISSRTPFVSAVKRAQKFLDAKSAAASSSTTTTTTTKGAKGKNAKKSRAEVTLRASGKAIDMALQVALHFQAARGGGGGGAYVVRITTGGVGVVDDVVRVGGEVEAFVGAGTGVGKRKREGEGEGEEDEGDGHGHGHGGGGKAEGGGGGEEMEGVEGVEEEEMEDVTMRERRVSTIEVVISVKEKQV